MSEQPTHFDKDKARKFMERLVNDVAISVHGAMNYLGDRLGIFKAMAGAGPMTSEELAYKSGLNERYLREWLGSMVAAQYIEYEPATRRYLLPDEHAGPLANEDSIVFLGGFLQSLIPNLGVVPKVAEAFKTGKGVPQSEYSPETWEALERTTAPLYRHRLVQQWMPTMPETVQKFEAGGTGLDVGCGSGRAAITLAKAYPKARLFGYDAHPESVQRARANAIAAGVADRVTFDVVDCTKLPESRFDFVSTFDVIHDSVDPVGLMASIRRSLRPGGAYLMMETNTSANVEDNINPVGRMLYSTSTLYCMTTSLAQGGAGIGALMGEPRARDLARQAGFAQFLRLPVKDMFSALYELKA